MLTRCAAEAGLVLPSPGEMCSEGALLGFEGVLLRKRVTSANTAFLVCRGSVSSAAAGAFAGDERHGSSEEDEGDAGEGGGFGEEEEGDGMDASEGKVEGEEVQVVMRSGELGEQARSCAKGLSLGCVLCARGRLYRTRTGTLSFLVHGIPQQWRQRRRQRAQQQQLQQPQPLPPRLSDSTGTTAASATPLCRIFARSGRCSSHELGRCNFRHAVPTAAEAAAATAAAAKQQSHLAAERHVDDPWSDEQKACKPRRARVFAEWLVEAFGLCADGGDGGDGSCCGGSGAGGSGGGGRRVFDVAGGKGALSAELVQLAGSGVACTVVEPRTSKPLKPRRTQRAPACAAAQSRTAPAGGACAAVVSGAVRSPPPAPAVPPPPPVQRCTALFSSEGRLPPGFAQVDAGCLLVGLHPDEATEAIVDAALRTGAAFAVVPCCVFPGLFPHRMLPCIGGSGSGSGGGGGQGRRPVFSYCDFCDFLQQKVKQGGRSCSLAFLPMQGKNRVLFSHSHRTLAVADTTGARAEWLVD